MVSILHSIIPLVACCVMTLICGNTNAFVTSSFATNIQNTLSLSSSEINLMSSFGLIGIFMTIPAGYFNDNFGPFKTILFASPLLSLSYLALSFVSNYYLLLMSYCGVGFASGAIFTCTLATGIKSVPSNPGLGVAIVGAVMSISLLYCNEFVALSGDVLSCSIHTKGCYPTIARSYAVVSFLMVFPVNFLLLLLRPASTTGEVIDEEDMLATHSMNIQRSYQTLEDEIDTEIARDLDVDERVRASKLMSYPRLTADDNLAVKDLPAPPKEKIEPHYAHEPETLSETSSLLIQKYRAGIEHEVHPLPRKDPTLEEEDDDGDDDDDVEDDDETIPTHIYHTMNPLYSLNTLLNVFFWLMIFGYFVGIGSSLLVLTQLSGSCSGDNCVCTGLWDNFLGYTGPNASDGSGNKYITFIGDGWSIINTTMNVLSGLLANYLIQRYKIGIHKQIGFLLLFWTSSTYFGLFALDYFTEAHSRRFFLQMCFMVLLLCQSAGFGSYLTMFPAAIGYVYGNVNWGLLFGYIQIGSCLATFVIPSLTGFICNQFSTYSWAYLIISITAGASGVGLLLSKPTELDSPCLPKENQYTRLYVKS